MNTGDPEILHRSEWDRALFWMVLLSALVHVVAVVVIVLLPNRFGLQAHPEQAYVVDLVSSDQLAGTNLVSGGKGRVAAPPKVEPKPPPPPPKVEEAKKPEPKKAEPPPPKKEEPKPPEKQAVAIAAATQPKPAAPTPTPAVEAKAAPPTTPPAKPKAEAKKEEKAKPEPTSVAVAKKQEAEKSARTPTLSKQELAARSRDQQIAKAIARVQQEGAGGGTGHQEKEHGGGPLSLGTGQGPGGGVVMGIEYLMYRNQLETRLKQSWAWAGRRDLEATVHFRIGEDGQIFDVRITRSSGDPAYDESVVRAVRAVNPLPSPPEAYRKEFSDVEYTFTPQNMG